MQREKILYSSSIILLIISILNFLGGQFYWYWTYKWFDIPVHMLGGAWIGLTTLWLWAHFSHLKVVKTFRMKAFWVVVFAIFFVGIFWEVFELFGGITDMTDKVYWPDTTGDILNDFIGGMFAYLLFIKTKKSGKEPVVISVRNNII